MRRKALFTHMVIAMSVGMAVTFIVPALLWLVSPHICHSVQLNCLGYWRAPAGGHWDVYKGRRLGVSVVTYKAFRELGELPPQLAAGNVGSDQLPSWARWGERDSAREPTWYVAYGWPCPSLVKAGPTEHRASWWGRGGLEAFPSRVHIAGSVTNATVFIAISYFCAAFVAIAYTQQRRRLRSRVGACQNCGYDLTSLDCPRCPECGDSIRNPD
jgi:hypothetical protein